MNHAAILITAAAGVMLIASTSTARANVEAGDGGMAFDVGNLADTAESLYNQITETPAGVDMNTANQQLAAFAAMVRESEGTARAGNPYAVCYGYKHTITDFSDHPKNTGEWPGERLPDSMCAAAGFGPGCISTAAGAYQIIRPTWNRIKAKLGLPDFSPASQDAAFYQLVAERGALEDVKAGRIQVAINKCRQEWASLPGNSAGQGQRSVGELVAWFQQNGGFVA